MKSKIALMTILMLTLPLAGCIEGSDMAGAVQTGGDDSTDTSTGSVVNNYYYNNTTIVENTNTSDYRYLVFGTESQNGAWPDTIPVYSTSEAAVLGRFNTTGNHLYSVVYGSETCQTDLGWENLAECGVYIQSTCDDVIHTRTRFVGQSETSSMMLRGTVEHNCSHLVYSVYTTTMLNEEDVVRLHYEIAFKQIPVSPY